MSNDSIHSKVSNQFGPVAENYATSTGHADKDALLRLVHLVNPNIGDGLLDIATGAGNTALAFAPHVARVVAYDLTEQMLEVTARRAAEEGLTNISTRQGKAESLPFQDSTFDIVTVRLAPHHFADIRRAVLEMARVVKPGGKVLVVDSTCPEDPELAGQVNAIEALRDPSHVRNHSPAEWEIMLSEAGLSIEYSHVESYLENGSPMLFDEWTRRIGTPEANVIELRGILQSASQPLAKALRLSNYEGEMRLTIDQITILASKPA